jgi:hypothetical protein
MSISFIITDRSITFVANGDVHSVDSSSPAFSSIRTMLASGDFDEDTLVALANPGLGLQQAFATAEQCRYLEPGTVLVTASTVFYNGEPVHTVLTERILSMVGQGFDVQPWLAFMSNLYRNPVASARDELYEFLEQADLPITPDGHFIAYKKVRDDYRDIHSGTFDNSVGQVIEMDRTKVNPDRTQTCSAGLHFCSKEYLPHFGATDGHHVMLVKINPADVVSIPNDYQFTKGRTWRYEVVGEIPFEEAFNRQWDPVTYEFGDWDDDDDVTIDELIDEYEALLADDDDTLDDNTEVIISSDKAGLLNARTLLSVRDAVGGSWSAVAAHFRVSTGTVSSWVDKLGLRGK